MKKSEIEKQEKQLEEMPLASLVIDEYREINKQLRKSNLLVSILAIFLAIAFAVETTYIIIYWDSMHPNAGMIREHNSE